MSTVRNPGRDRGAASTRTGRLLGVHPVWRLLLVPLAVLALLVGLVTQAPRAEAATLYGHDISWPQCPSSVGGYDLPMPPTTTEFVIIGLTFGLPFTENPCLASQVQWSRTHSTPAHAYTMAAFPTSAQLATYGSAGPWSSTTRAGRLSNVGYAEARYAVASLARVGFRPPVVWIDVEPRPAQPWPTGSAVTHRENRYVVEGLMRGLHDAGYAYGLYSYLAGWQDITGGWRVPGVPVWATAGRLDYPTEALDRCSQASFSGGRVYISQWYDDARDYDLTCDPYAFTPLPMPPSSLSNSSAEFDGDWSNDLFAREAATGYLWLYRGDGDGGWLPRVRFGAGWRAFSALETPGDFNGDGSLDVLAREAATGSLWLYPGNGSGGWLPRVRVGTGWNGVNAVFSTGDFTGDQRPDVLAREAATGYLWLYPGNGTGGWLSKIRVGTGWGMFDALVGPGDFNGDGRSDVLARETATGYLWLYPGNGSGGWLPRVRVGRGWSTMSPLVSPGDFNGDRTSDLLARDRSGYLWLYPGNGTGGWLTPVRFGSGWNAMNALF